MIRRIGNYRVDQWPGPGRRNEKIKRVKGQKSLNIASYT